MPAEALKITPTPVRTTRILLVEDDAADAYILRRVLKSENGEEMSVEHVEDLTEGLERLTRSDFDCVLLDLNLPDSSGLESFYRMSHENPDVPVVVLSGLDDHGTAVSAVREGAQDYLVKGKFDGQLLARAIRYAIERHHTKELLRSLSLEDDLTGLYNRRGFMTLAEQQLKLARRQKHVLYLFFTDLDNLKEINDTLGHDVGNQAIVEAAEILERTFRESDILARVGGDELVALLDADGDGSYEELADRLRTRITEKNAAPGRCYRLSLSVGIARFDPRRPVDLQELMKQADQAMYAEKRCKKALLKEGLPA